MGLPLIKKASRPACWVSLEPRTATWRPWSSSSAARITATCRSATWRASWRWASGWRAPRPDSSSERGGERRGQGRGRANAHRVGGGGSFSLHPRKLSFLQGGVNSNQGEGAQGRGRANAPRDWAEKTHAHLAGWVLGDEQICAVSIIYAPQNSKERSAMASVQSPASWTCWGFPFLFDHEPWFAL